MPFSLPVPDAARDRPRFFVHPGGQAPRDFGGLLSEADMSFNGRDGAIGTPRRSRALGSRKMSIAHLPAFPPAPGLRRRARACRREFPRYRSASDAPHAGGNAAQPEMETGEGKDLFTSGQLPAAIEDAGDQNFVASTKKAMPTRRSKPTIRMPGRMSFRIVPRIGYCLKSARNARIRPV